MPALIGRSLKKISGLFGQIPQAQVRMCGNWRVVSKCNAIRIGKMGVAGE